MIDALWHILGVLLLIGGIMLVIMLLCALVIVSIEGVMQLIEEWRELH